MKKSTLITTIAMIVVVVVALSTATYAWFSSATTTSASDTITTTAQADWIIMGSTRSTVSTGEHPTDTITFSSGAPLTLNMLDGLYAPTAEIIAIPSSNTNTATFELSKFFNALQEGTGQLETAQATSQPNVDPIVETGTNITSAANYVRVINTKADGSDAAANAQDLYLTITVVVGGTEDSNFYAANAFCTYVAWKGANSISGSANTAYYPGTVEDTTTGTGAGYYEATRSTKIEKSENVVYQQGIDAHNEGKNVLTNASIAIPSDNYATSGTIAAQTALKIGTEQLENVKYYQIKIKLVDSLPANSPVNIAFYAWFDGWVLDNTGSNSEATVYYEFGNS